MYDIVISAQAFHWIDPTIGLHKAYTALKDNGILALFWNFINFEEEPLLREIKDVLIAYAPAFQEWPDASTTRFNSFSNYWYEQISSSIHFTQPQFEVIASNITYVTDDFRKLIETFSWFQTLEEQNKHDLQEKLSERLSGTIVKINLPVRTIILTGIKAAA
ncbi:MAG: class I SAM-dependent methyltransferase [Chloroflexaceae bacterium]|nr:class I SAM-dependent methyltransferase [Chloroflexaceae bacterium]